MPTDLTRRSLILAALAGAAVSAVPGPALALDNAGAASLIDSLVGEINGIINSGKPETAMYRDFEKLFGKYADIDIIARQTLGPDARRASARQMSAYTAAFQGYISRKYGKRFREFIGGKIQVQGSRPVKSFYEVKTTAVLQGQAPFEVIFLVSDKSGRNLFFDMLIEGISLLKAERTEIGSMLDKERGNIDAMIADLRKAG
jgi:phospholipid transport system substrate-binding protein